MHNKYENWISTTILLRISVKNEKKKTGKQQQPIRRRLYFRCIKHTHDRPNDPIEFDEEKKKRNAAPHT